MKTTLIALSASLLAGTASVLTGCNSCAMHMKNLESDYSELDRDITVINSFNGDTLFSYTGPCYFSIDSSGSVTLIYKVNGKRKKADFAGSGFVFQAIEK